jgi:hypothetical protein
MHNDLRDVEEDYPDINIQMIRIQTNDKKDVDPTNNYQRTKMFIFIVFSNPPLLQ